MPRSASSSPTTALRPRGARARPQGRGRGSRSSRCAATWTRCAGDRDETAGRGRDRHPHAAPRDGRGHPDRPRSCARRHPEIGVVVLSQYADPKYSARPAEGGSDGRAYSSRSACSDRASSSRDRGGRARAARSIDPKVVEALVAARSARRAARRSPSSRRASSRSSREWRGHEQPAIAEALVPHQAGRREAHQRNLREARPRTRSTMSRRVKAALIYLADTPAN